MIRDLYCPLTGGKCASETSFAVNLAVLVLSVLLTFACYAAGVRSYVVLCAVLMGAELLTTVGLEALLYPKTSALRRLRVRRPLNWKRVWFREVALLSTLSCIAFAYWLFPAFSDRVMVLCFYPFLKIVVPVLLLASLPYFCLMDRLDVEDEDVPCRIGRALCTWRMTVTCFELANYVRSWIVKAFWLSIMQPQIIEKLRVFICYRWEKLAGHPMEIYLMASTICYAIDLAYAAPGYLLNVKMFNTQTRTAEPTLFGWLVGILCYWPFYGVLFYPYFFKYETAGRWTTVFAEGSAVWWIWGGAIIMLELGYALSTVSAGIRFSNLTYRGLWNTGPYRLTKHPAYVFKCVSWWLVTLPFVVNTGALAIKSSLLLLCVNGIYYLRARTEERHLSHYPEYVAYALEMNDRSIFRWVARVLPFLKYRPLAKESKLFSVDRDL